ncbi:hypothetical protein, partial [Xanthomonas sp. D-99]|uniref:hypothetical protein n=1 Tax=Xanthomonas sp. D-99 TaxID=2821273 RepID=UPI001ADBA583
NREIPAESARNGEIPKFQKPLFGTTPPSALSGLVVQTFPKPSQAKKNTYAQTPDNATSIDAKTLGCYSASHC